MDSRSGHVTSNIEMKEEGVHFASKCENYLLCLEYW